MSEEGAADDGSPGWPYCELIGREHLSKIRIARPCSQSLARRHFHARSGGTYQEQRINRNVA